MIARAWNNDLDRAGNTEYEDVCRRSQAAEFRPRRFLGSTRRRYAVNSHAMGRAFLASRTIPRTDIDRPSGTPEIRSRGKLWSMHARRRPCALPAHRAAKSYVRGFLRTVLAVTSRAAGRRAAARNPAALFLPARTNIQESTPCKIHSV